MQTIYISGKVTGIEEEATMYFDCVKCAISARNHNPINPMELDHSQHDKTWQSYMRVCISAMMQADAIVLLSNWKESRGARLEKYLAEQLGIKVYNTVDEMLAHISTTAQVCDATKAAYITDAGY